MRALLALLFLTALSSSASADCQSPVGVRGATQWNADNLEVQYCDGSAWHSTAVSTTATSCTVSGTIQYRSSDLQFCNGSYWVSMNGAATGSTCSGAVGAMTFDTTIDAMKWCDGTNWRLLGGSQLSFAVTGRANSTSNTATYNFSSVNLGTASASRYILVGINSRAAATYLPSAVTIGGISATEVGTYQESNTVASFYVALVPTGTAATVSVTFTGAMERAAIQTWALTNLQSVTPVTTYSQPHSNLYRSINIPAGGAAFAVVGGTTSGTYYPATYSGLTHNYSGRIMDDYDMAYAGASLATSTAVTAKTVGAATTSSWTNRAGIIVILR